MVITGFVMMITGICMMKTDVWMRIYHKITLIYLSKYHDSRCIHEENRYKYYENRDLYDDNQGLYDENRTCMMTRSPANDDMPSQA